MEKNKVILSIVFVLAGMAGFLIVSGIIDRAEREKSACDLEVVVCESEE